MEPKTGSDKSGERGSGTDINSDTRRLKNPENLFDKTEEDTFPASDPPSTSPIVGVGAGGGGFDGGAQENSQKEDPSHLPPDFKDNTKAQFNYGRRSQAATHHFDQTSRRLERGNPDVGEIDLGNIEADRPAEPDDNDHYD